MHMLAGQPRGLVPASLTRRGCSPNAGSVSKGAAAGEGPGEAGSSQASRGGPRPSCPLPAPEGGTPPTTPGGGRLASRLTGGCRSSPAGAARCC